MPQPAANDAGPSRPRRDSALSASTKSADAAGSAQNLSRDNSASGTSSATPTQRRPASPKSAMSRSASPGKDKDGREAATPHLDLTLYPTPKLLKLLAGLLQQIASANDALRAEQEEEPEEEEGSTTTDSRSRSSITHPSPTTALFHDDPPPDLANGDPLFTASKVSLSHPSSILSFHARHVPSISIEAYLLRILKYCPTTNEVFLGLLVYFDRMSRLGTTAGVGGTSAAVGPRGFSIDSYNIHRLIIAGVTVASKFFSGECKKEFRSASAPLLGSSALAGIGEGRRVISLAPSRAPAATSCRYKWCGEQSYLMQSMWGDSMCPRVPPLPPTRSS